MSMNSEYHSQDNMVDAYAPEIPEVMSWHVPPLPANPQVTMAYVPFQNMDDVFIPEEALRRGTLFPELDKPFLGERGFTK